MHHENYSIHRNEYPRGEANPTVSIRLIDKKKYKKYKKEKKIYLRNYDERMFDLERRIARKGCEENALMDKIIARGRSRRGNTWETRFYKRGQTSPIFAQAATNQIYIRSIILIYRNSIWFSTGLSLDRSYYYLVLYLYLYLPVVYQRVVSNRIRKLHTIVFFRLDNSITYHVIFINETNG